MDEGAKFPGVPTLLATCVTVLFVQLASAQTAGEVSIAAGAAVPAGSSARGYGAGPEFQLGVGYQTRSRFVVSLHAQHARLDNELAGGILSITGGFLNVSRRFGEHATLRPGINAALGVHSLKQRNNPRRTSSSVSLGAGLDAAVSAQASIFVDARYRFHLTDYGGSGDFRATTNWPILLGVRVRIRNAAAD